MSPLPCQWMGKGPHTLKHEFYTHSSSTLERQKVSCHPLRLGELCPKYLQFPFGTKARKEQHQISNFRARPVDNSWFLFELVSWLFQVWCMFIYRVARNNLQTLKKIIQSFSFYKAVFHLVIFEWYQMKIDFDLKLMIMFWRSPHPPGAVPSPRTYSLSVYRCGYPQGWLKCGVGSERNLWHFVRLIARILMFRDKKYRMLTFRDKKYRILTFRDKTESYLTVLQQNNAEAC